MAFALLEYLGMKSEDVQVSQKMLYAVRDDLKSSTTSLEVKIDKKFESVDRRFMKIDERFEDSGRKFERIEKKLEQHDAYFERTFEELAGIRADLAGMNTMLKKILVMMEEQNNRNKYVMDQYNTVTDKQGDHESRILFLETSLKDYDPKV